MIIESKDNNSDKILAYTYMLYFRLNDEIKYYYGVRYGNVKLNLSPKNDIFTKYFTSSNSVLNLLNNGIKPYKVLIHKTFNTSVDACKYEVKFLEKVNAKNRKDFLNQTNTFDNSLPNNLGRVISEERRKEMSEISKKTQSKKEYKLKRSIMMKEKWSDPKYINEMKNKNKKYVESGESKIAGEKSGSSRTGYKYNDEVKLKRSQKLKEVCKTLDMKSRALNRKRFICPICELSNLDGGNFNSHMKSKHDWSKEDCQIFKKIIS